MNGSALARALSDLGVEFLMDSQGSVEHVRQIQPVDLIAGLASSSESRLRLALIPLLLQRPEFSEFVSDALASLSATARITLRCYYCAAVCLQGKYRARLVNLFGLQPALPTLFFEELGLDPNGDSEKNLQNLAQRQIFLTSRPINWLGTYEHAALRLLNHKEREPEWLM